MGDWREIEVDGLESMPWTSRPRGSTVRYLDCNQDNHIIGASTVGLIYVNAMVFLIQQFQQ